MLQMQQQELQTIPFQRGWATAKLLILIKELAVSAAWVCWLQEERKNKLINCVFVVGCGKGNREGDSMGTTRSSINCRASSKLLGNSPELWRQEPVVSRQNCSYNWVTAEALTTLKRSFTRICSGFFFTPVITMQSHGSRRMFFHMKDSKNSSSVVHIIPE